MRLLLAIRAFFKALKNPLSAEKFLEDKAIKPEISETPSHLRLLAQLQQSARLIDFLKEDISGFNDAEVGGVVRKIHEECGKCLEELVTIRPVIEQEEGQKIHVPQGYDPLKIKVVGNVKGAPPYNGILTHKGWQAHKRSLPKKISSVLTDVIAPAEVEIR